jgi:subtilase family serine protease
MRKTVLRAGLAMTAAALAGLSVAAGAPPAALAGLSVAAGAPPAALAATGGGRVALPSPVPPPDPFASDLGPASAAVTVPIRIYLAGRSALVLTRFATAVSAPGSPAYGHYLTPAQFRARFGPTSAQAAAVVAWAQAAGLRVTGTTSHYVAATGSAPAVSAALDTSIHAFGSGSVASSYAPVSGMSVPASLGHDVSTVTGLNEAISQGPATQRRPPSAPASMAGAGFTCSAWWGQHLTAIPEAEGHTSAPDGVCGYTPQQLRSAYGVGPDNGQGATVAIVLDGSLATMLADANRFFASHRLPGFAPGQFTVNTGPGFAASCAGNADVPEEPLDVETVHTIAPAAKVTYVAANCTADPQQGLLDAETRVVDQHLGDVSTESFSVLESNFTPAVAAAWTQVFEQGAAEGIGFNFDSGDGGDSSAGVAIGAGGTRGGVTPADLGNPKAVTFPASDPWATAVGGTTLEIGRSGAVTGELGWGDTGTDENATGTGYSEPPPGSFQEGSTGGRSTLFPQPAYQRGVVPAALSTDGGTMPPGREVPDVAADASPVTGWQIAYTPPGGQYGQIIEGGTSGSSPIVASLEADAKQFAGHAIGFADPLLYDLRHSAGIRDITAPASPAVVLVPNSACFAVSTPGPGPCLITIGLDTSLTEAPGYDDVTGVGSVTDNLISALARG